MNTIVIYNSQTGFTRQYAEWIADAKGATLMELSAAKKADLSAYDAIVFGGWACAGAISKIGWFRSNLPKWQGKRLIAFCVGGSPAENPELPDGLARIREQLPGVQVFYCPGGFRFEKMKLPYRLAMKAFLAALRSKKDKTPTDEGALQLMSASYDLSSPTYIEPIVKALQD